MASHWSPSSSEYKTPHRAHVLGIRSLRESLTVTLETIYQPPGASTEPHLPRPSRLSPLSAQVR